LSYYFIIIYFSRQKKLETFYNFFEIKRHLVPYTAPSWTLCSTLFKSVHVHVMSLCRSASSF